MVRYCPNCKREFDFNIRSVKDLENLSCPECKIQIPSDSRKPVMESENEKPANTIGAVYVRMLRFFYVFLIICSILGVWFYLAHLDTALLIVTIIAVIFGLVRYGSLGFCCLLLAGGGIVGWGLLKTVRGACLGVMIGCIVFCVIRGLFYRLIGALIKAGR